MDTKKTFKILSIDGGGILGLYSADVLAKIQKEYCNNEPLSNHFNLITGTSTGGIIALALATGEECERIKKFYQDYGNSIFPSKRRRKLGLFCNKYSNTNLHNALNAFFGPKTIKDCKTKVCIPSINASTCKPIVFKTNNNCTQTRDEDYSLVNIALATSAAPTYLPMHKFDNFQGLVDGGLWQNNPALIGFIEAISYCVGDNKPYDKIKILSIGNPNSSIKESINTKNTNSGLLKWKGNLVSLPMKVSSIGTDEILSILARNKTANLVDYLRIDCGVLSDNFKGLKLDSADDSSLKKLLELSSQNFYDNKDKLNNFFKEEK